MNDEILKTTRETIRAFIKKFRDFPYDYLLESDIQADLFAMLRERIDLRIEVPAKEHKHINQYNLNLVYSEYSNLIDLCCLDYDEIANTDDFEVQKPGHDDYIYRLPVLLAIELKFIKGERTGRFYEGIDKDIKKIAACRVERRIANWLSICFVQSQIIAEQHIQNLRIGYKTTLLKDEITELKGAYIVTPENTFRLTKVVQ